MQTPTPLYLASVLALGTSAQWLAWRLQLPAIVLLLAFGFSLGLVADPEDYVGEAVLPMVSLAVGVILFEGGLSLQLREVRETSGVVLRLVTVGLLVTWLGGAVAARMLLGFSWSMATLVGALLTVSGPTVILPLLRQVRPERRVGSVIKWEGIVNDPIGAVLAALVFEVVRSLAAGGEAGAEGSGVFLMVLGSLATTLVVGLALGALTAAALIALLSRFLVPDYLQNPVILAIVILVFAVSNALSPESGLVTVTVLGVLLANQERVTVKHIVEFKENLRVLLISVLFIVLSSRVSISWKQLGDIGWGGLLFVAAMILLVRPAAAGLATLGSELRRNERLLLSWIHPRGIVAAAVASLFAIELQELAVELDNTVLAAEADRMVLVTFLVIVGTVTVYGLSLGPLAKRLGLAGDEPQGVLFAGATPMVREIASALKSEGFDVLLVDTNPQNIAAARMGGLPVSYASIGSEFIREEVDLGEVGRLMAMTPNDEVNSLAATEFAEMFGSANVYQFAAPASKERLERVPSHRRGRALFAEGVTHDALQLRFAAGAVIKKTTLSDDFTIDDFRERYPSALLLFTLPENGKLAICTPGRKFEPRPGKKLIALVDADEAATASDSGILR
ncbi:MAG: cation:proton antiporter [Planctomycetota bacterium]